MRKKPVKRGRKSKEERLLAESEKLLITIKELEVNYSELKEECKRYEDRLRSRIESLLSTIRKLETDKRGLNSAISTLGIRLEELQEVNINRSGNYNDTQATINYIDD